MPSVQVITTPLLRQYATTLDDGMIEIATKLGSTTVSRSSFSIVEYPSSAEDRKDFLMGLLLDGNPAALAVLQGSAEKCLNDQMTAVQRVIGEK